MVTLVQVGGLEHSIFLLIYDTPRIGDRALYNDSTSRIIESEADMANIKGVLIPFIQSVKEVQNESS